MRKKINNTLIRSFKPCYDPSEINADDKELLSVKKWILKYRDIVKNKHDILWLICREELMTDKDLRLFAVWCARETFKITVADERSIEVCNVAERYANGLASDEELENVRLVALKANLSAAWSAVKPSARAVANSAALSVISEYRISKLTIEEARNKQIEQLLTYFK